LCAWDHDGNEDIEQVWVRIDQGWWHEATFVEVDDECSWWVYEWDTTLWDDGEHHVYARAWDGEDYSELDVIGVIVDNEPDNHAPGVEIVEPAHGEEVSGVVRILICAWDEDGFDDIEQVWIRIDDGSLREAIFFEVEGECSWWIYEWDSTEVDNGWHSITAIVFDGEDDGHDTIEVYVNN
jgi:hypothetical protein